MWFIKGPSNSLKALNLKTKLLDIVKKRFSRFRLHSDKIKQSEVNDNKSIELAYVALDVRIKTLFINTSNKFWKLCFGNQSILFADKNKISDNQRSIKQKQSWSPHINKPKLNNKHDDI